MNLLHERIVVGEWRAGDHRMRADYVLELSAPHRPGIVGPVVGLTRIFGRAGEMKTIRFSLDEADGLIIGLHEAVKQWPEAPGRNRVPVGMVEAPDFGSITICWDSWWWGRDAALFMRQDRPSGGSVAVAVRAQYAKQFFTWFVHRIVAAQRVVGKW